jgi:hypothetical protein
LIAGVHPERYAHDPGKIVLASSVTVIWRLRLGKPASKKLALSWLSSTRWH